MSTTRPFCDECHHVYVEGEKVWVFAAQFEPWSYCTHCYDKLSDEDKRWYSLETYTSAETAWTGPIVCYIPGIS